MAHTEAPASAGGDEEVSTGRTVDVMLVNTRPLVRGGLCALIEHEPDLVVVAQAASVGDAGDLDVEPDVIVTDLDLPDAQQDDVIESLRGRFPKSSILVLTQEDHPATVESVLAAGADGYLLLDTAAATDLLTGIRALAAGETFLQSSLGVGLARLHQPRDRTLALSHQEEQVLRLVALGHTNAEVARQHGVSLRTVEAHRSRIHQKTGCRTRAELVQYARQAGLVEPWGRANMR